MYYDQEEATQIHQYFKEIKQEITTLLAQLENPSMECEKLPKTHIALVSFKAKLQADFHKLKRTTTVKRNSLTCESFLKPALNTICLDFKVRNSIPAYSMQWKVALLKVHETIEHYDKQVSRELKKLKRNKRKTIVTG